MERAIASRPYLPHYLQTEAVPCNPQNPVNPDSEANVRGKFYR